jgi:outer membrane receptor protein involved in Fe transport
VNTHIAMSHADEVTRRALQLFPTVALHWHHDDESAARYSLSFSRRLERPDAAMLNPYSMGEDDMNSFIGNPLLRSEISNQLQLGLEFRSNAVTIVATPFLTSSSNAIRPIKAVTAAGRSTTTLQNLASTRSAGADISVKAQLAPQVKALISSSGYYLATRGELAGNSLESSGMYVNLRANIDVQVTRTTTAQLYGYRRSSQPVEQGEILPTFNSDFALAQRLGREGRGTVTLRVSDPFNSNRLVFHLNDPTFSQHSERRVTSRAAALSFTWSVGGERAQAQHHEEKAQIF